MAALRKHLKPAAPGLSPKAVLEQLGAIKMVDVCLPTSDGRWLIMPRHTEPEPEQSMLLDKLGLTLPAQPPPRIRGGKECGGNNFPIFREFHVVLPMVSWGRLSDMDVVMEFYSKSMSDVMKKFYDSLSEKDRRRYAAVEVAKLGHGGVGYIAQILGCDPKTIGQGYDDLEQPELPAVGRVRKKGAAAIG
jgi:hypothetical protein